MPCEFPTIEVIALNRMAYGPGPGDLERARDMGFKSYVEEQLNPNDKDDSLANFKLAQATLQIKYPAGENWEAVDEDRPLEHLNTPIGELWTSLVGREGGFIFPELMRPAQEVIAARFLRARFSKWQLREVMTEFWHDHFNVDAFSEPQISIGLPTYDRDVIRANALGNFRVMLEGVAQAMSMQYYLDNVDNKGTPANENFAREVMELHTLGADVYFNDRYDSWEQVPGALEGETTGFIDADVRELARVLTGWTTANGARNPYHTADPSTWRLPFSGEFLFYEDWHDDGEKRVLGEIIPAGQGLEGGRRVLEKLAAHPSTARFVCRKICARLIADEPPESIIAATAQTFADNIDAPDQIARVVRTILMSEEFATAWGKKTKRPFEVVVSFLRALGADFMPNQNFANVMDSAGHLPFRWPTPTGYPDIMDYWLNTNVVLTQWNTQYALALNWFKTGEVNLAWQIPREALNGEGVIEFLNGRLFGYRPGDQTVGLFSDLARVIDNEAPFLRYYPQGATFLLNFVAASMAMAPEFLSK